MNMLLQYKRLIPMVQRQLIPYVFSHEKHFSTIQSDTVLVSTSDDIFENLALEKWLHSKANLRNGDRNNSILLIWKNKPAVVIGRRQNPFLECDVWNLTEASVPIARRESGGGAVYHDEGNMNFSFIDAKKTVGGDDKRRNLKLVFDAIKRKWNVNYDFGEHFNVLVDGNKVSGTAAREGTANSNSYHHFTLMLNVDQVKLGRYLNSPLSQHIDEGDVKSKKSIKVNVVNLSEEIGQGVAFESMAKLIGNEFLKEKGNEKKENIKWISPEEENFRGIGDILEGLKHPKWVFGGTPAFYLKRSFDSDVKVHISVESGTIVSVETGNKNVDEAMEKYLLGKHLQYEELKEHLVAIDVDPIFTDNSNERKILKNVATTLAIDFL